MKRYVISIFKHFLFWMLFFAIGRFIFLLSNISQLNSIGFLEIVSSFFYALKLDFSTACYLMVFPFLILTLQLVVKAKWLNGILKIYAMITILTCYVITFADINIYGEWSNKLNYKALIYLQHPDEVLKSATNFQLFFFIIGIVVITFLAFMVYLKKVLRPPIDQKKPMYWQSVLALVLGSGIIVIGLRGGLGEIPISQSSAYYSKHQVLNDIAVNPEWNLIHSCVNFSSLNKENPFIFMDENQAQKLFDELHEVAIDSCEKVVKNDSINIVILLMESWSADLIESLGGRSGITPFFHELEKEGLLFTNFYSNGHRSQQGISAIFSGFPPIPITAITDNFEKYSKLNSLPKSLKSKQYHSSFYFGGDLNYGNLKAYLMAMQFDKIIDEEGFPKHLKRGKLSIFDQETLPYHLANLPSKPQPFFSVIFTASTHSPYDEPKIVEQLTWNVNKLAYLNSAKYTDFCLGAYFEQAKKEPWYDNTLFIIVADHSHVTYNNWDYYTKEYQHIPMMWLGGALKEEYKGTTNDKLCSHIDLPKTILNQLDISSEGWIWSKDIFNPYTQEFSMCETNQGMGWIRKNLFFYLNGFDNRVMNSSTPSDSLLREQEYGKAYLQILYDTYLKY